MRQSEDAEGSEAVVCRCSLKYVFRRTPVLESHLINLKRDSTLAFFCKYCKNLKNSFFVEHLQWLLLKAKQNVTKEECIPCNTLWCLSCQLIIATATFGSIEKKWRFCIYHKVSTYENVLSAKFSKSESPKFLFWHKIKITTERI